MKAFFKKYRWIFQVIISLILAVYIYNRIDFHSLWKSLSLVPWYTLLVIPLIGLLQVYITAFTQLRLFSIYENNIDFNRSMRENYVAAFIGMAVPGLVGSDLYLVTYFGKKVNSYFNAFTGIFFLRLLGLLVFVLSITLALLMLDQKTYSLIRQFDFELKQYILIGILAGISILVAGYFIVKNYLKHWYTKVVNKLAPIKQMLILEKQRILIIIFQIMLYYVVAIGGRAILARYAGISLPVMELAALIMVVNLLIMLPISYSGIGIREGGYIGLLVLLGIDKNKAVLFSILDFSVTLFVFSVGAFIALYQSLRFKKSVIKDLHPETITTPSSGNN